MEYRDKIMRRARQACGRGAPEAQVLEKAIYYATKWAGHSEEEARRIFIDNEPPRTVTLDDISQEARDWLLSGKKPAMARR